jgi:hypothetical protein
MPDQRQRIIEISEPVTTAAEFAAIALALRRGVDHAAIRSFADIERLVAAADEFSDALGELKYVDITEEGAYTLASGPDGRA